MKSLPKITLGILLIINLLSLFYFRNWEEWMLGNGDSYGYYAYLPMTFIHHDFKTLRLETYHRKKNTVDHKNEDLRPILCPIGGFLAFLPPMVVASIYIRVALR